MQDVVGADLRVVQSVWVSKSFAPAFETAKAWVQSLKLSIAKPSETKGFWRFQQQDPSLFVPGTYQTRQISSGIQAKVALHRPGIFDGMKARRLK